MFRAALHMVISDFKMFIVFVALGLPFPQVHLSMGGGGGGGGRSRGFQFKISQLLASTHNPECVVSVRLFLTHSDGMNQ